MNQPDEKIRSMPARWRGSRIDWFALAPPAVARSQITWERCGVAHRMRKAGCAYKQIGEFFSVSSARATQMVAWFEYRLNRDRQSPVNRYFDDNPMEDYTVDFLKHARRFEDDAQKVASGVFKRRGKQLMKMLDGVSLRMSVPRDWLFVGTA